MPLTDTGMRRAAPKSLYKLFDERGLYLEISFCRRSMVATEIQIRGAAEPGVSGRLSGCRQQAARGRRDEARKVLNNEVDPSER